MRKYKHLFFDLDHTLWDYDKNSYEVLCDIYRDYELSSKGIHVFDDFIVQYNRINAQLWSLFNQNKIDRETIRKNRFLEILRQFRVEDEQLAEEMSGVFLLSCPRKTHLMPHTKEVLDRLKGTYKLHILTNGFDDVQFIKLESSGLSHYFDEVITSDNAAAKKPSGQIFEYALQKTGAEKRESIMIGDNLQTDILGARNIKMDQVFYNPAGKKHEASVTYEIHCLSSLPKLFL